MGSRRKRMISTPSGNCSAAPAKNYKLTTMDKAEPTHLSALRAPFLTGRTGCRPYNDRKSFPSGKVPEGRIGLWRLLFLSVLLLLLSPPASAAGSKIYVIDVHGTVWQGQANFVKQKLDEAAAQGRVRRHPGRRHLRRLRLRPRWTSKTPSSATTRTTPRSPTSTTAPSRRAR